MLPKYKCREESYLQYTRKCQLLGFIEEKLKQVIKGCYISEPVLGVSKRNYNFNCFQLAYSFRIIYYLYFRTEVQNRYQNVIQCSFEHRLDHYL